MSVLRGLEIAITLIGKCAPLSLIDQGGLRSYQSHVLAATTHVDFSSYCATGGSPSPYAAGSSLNLAHTQ